MRLFVSSFVFLLFVVLASGLFAEVPELIGYQGVLFDSNGDPVETSVDVTFGIWDAQTAGNQLWEETQSFTPDNNGAFNISLGTINPLYFSVFDYPELWLSIRVNDDPELSPRSRFLSTPFSFVTGTIDGAVGGSIDGDLIVSGKIGVGIENPDTKFEVFVDTEDSPWIQLEAPPELQSGLTIKPLFAIVVIDLDGRLNLNMHGNLALAVDDDGNVGINTDSPSAKLDVAGTPGVDGIRFPDGTLQTTAAGGSGGGWVDDGSIIRLSDNLDNVGIGTSTPAAKLDVDGPVILRDGLQAIDVEIVSLELTGAGPLIVNPGNIVDIAAPVTFRDEVVFGDPPSITLDDINLDGDLDLVALSGSSVNVFAGARLDVVGPADFSGGVLITVEDLELSGDADITLEANSDIITNGDIRLSGSADIRLEAGDQSASLTNNDLTLDDLTTGDQTRVHRTEGLSVLDGNTFELARVRSDGVQISGSAGTHGELTDEELELIRNAGNEIARCTVDELTLDDLSTGDQVRVHRTEGVLVVDGSTLDVARVRSDGVQLSGSANTHGELTAEDLELIRNAGNEIARCTVDDLTLDNLTTGDQARLHRTDGLTLVLAASGTDAVYNANGVQLTGPLADEFRANPTSLSFTRPSTNDAVRIDITSSDLMTCDLDDDGSPDVRYTSSPSNRLVLSSGTSLVCDGPASLTTCDVSGSATYGSSVSVSGGLTCSGTVFCRNSAIYDMNDDATDDVTFDASPSPKVTFASGTTMRCDGSAELAGSTTCSGSLTFSGGASLTCSDNDFGSVYIGTGGSVSIRSSTDINAASLTVTGGGSLDLSGSSFSCDATSTATLDCPTTINNTLTCNNPVTVNSDLTVGIGGPGPGALHVNGDITATGAKLFVQDHPTDQQKEIHYVSLEGGEAGTYVRGSAKLINGSIEIDLPEHFSLVTNKEGLTVQITPRGPVQSMLYVETVTPEKLIIKASNLNDDDIAFDYLVNGVRLGFEDHEVIRDKMYVALSK
ncbi:MAG: hypothetical protein V3W18_05265 [candidate division Zixibacteria bacterium]